VIVAETPETYRLVTQPDHAALAGQFADHWGSDAFGRPAPAPSVAIAAHVHDDGWWRHDRRPHRGDGGAPENFTALPPATWIDLYDEGIDAAIELDPYAGLLVSMHGTGLRRRRYGLSPSWPPTPPPFADFVDRQEALQERLARGLVEDDRRGRLSDADLALLSTLHGTGSAPDDGTDSRLWCNYELLQAWDALSLSFCTTTSPPGDPTIHAVPVDAAGSEVALTVEPLGDDAFRVDPYPFDADPLAVSVPARTVRKDAFDDEAGLVRAYYAADHETETFTLRGVEG
jgi:hypothetical protein